MANALIELPVPYIGDFGKGRPIFNGQIYVGVVDLDPEIPANQKQIVGIQENGTEVNLPQPVATSSGGYPTYNGAPIRLAVDGAYSLKILDKQGNQEYYFSNVEQGAPVVFSDSPVLSRRTVAIAVADTDLVIGQYITTEGYHSANDDGGASYVVVAGGTGTDDGGSYHDMDNGSQLELISHGIVSLFVFGVAGDGVSDDTSKINKCLEYCKASGQQAFAKSAMYLVTDTIVVDCEFIANKYYDRTDLTKGPIFYITHSGSQAFTLKSGGTIAGFTFYYPDQVTTAAPLAYPATIVCFTEAPSTSAINIVIEKNTFVNSYIGINMNGLQANNISTFIRIQNNDICCIALGISNPFNLMENDISANAFTYAVWKASINQPIRGVISSRAVGISLNQSVGTGITNNTFFGLKVAVKMSEFVTITRINNNFMDGCINGIDYSDLTNFGDVIVSGNVFLGKDPNNSEFTACACIKGDFSGGIARGGFVNVFSNVFSGTNGSHIFFNVGDTSNNIRFNITGNSFLNAGRNDVVNTRYSVYINDSTANPNSDVIVSSNKITETANQANTKITGIRIVGRDISVTSNVITNANIAVSLAGLNSNARTTVDNNISRLSVTKDFEYTPTRGVNKIGMNQWNDGSSPSNIASAAIMTIPDGSSDFLDVTGTTDITSITGSWPDRGITLKFGGSLTVFDGLTLNLAGDFTTTGGDTLSLISTGTEWVETSRSVN